MSKDKKNNTKKNVKHNRKEEILQEATRQLGINGFRGTTTASIAKAVGLTEQGVLHYFPSKTILLQSVLEYREQQDIEKFRTRYEQGDFSFFELFEDLASENEKNPELIKLFTVLVGESFNKDHPSHDFFVNRYRITREQTAQYITNVISKEKLAFEGDVEQLATLLLAVMDGLQIQWLLHPEEVDMVASFKLFTNIVRGYLEKDN